MKITNLEEIKNKLPRIPEDAHKYTRGRLFMVCGSYGMAGALILSAKAALRTGVGYLDLALSSRIYPIVTSAIPEAVCSVYDENDPEQIRSIIQNGCKKADAVLAGCGLGVMREILMPLVLEYCTKPLILDADGLNWLSEHQESSFLSEDLVLTPHEGEMARLLFTTSIMVHENREKSVQEASKNYRASVLLKGPKTLICKECFDTYMNPTGNAGMARAGSGDVLSGIIGSLMAQGMNGFDAAVSGAYIHGMAGDKAKEIYGIRSMTPSDIIQNINKTIVRLS